jgi:hypothetical protein
MHFVNINLNYRRFNFLLTLGWKPFSKVLIKFARFRNVWKGLGVRDCSELNQFSAGVDKMLVVQASGEIRDNIETPGRSNK